MLSTAPNRHLFKFFLFNKFVNIYIAFFFVVISVSVFNIAIKQIACNFLHL